MNLERDDTDICPQVMEASTYDTLEALATHLAGALRDHLASREADQPQDGRHIRIGLEKPTAIPLAEAACVELRTNMGPLA